MTKPKKTARQLAEEHWRWLEPVLLQQLKLTELLFIDAMIHGHKHGKESKR